MEIKTLAGYSYASNTYVLISDGDAAVVDPSAPVSMIENAIGCAKLRFILMTHGHFDHMITLDSLRSKYGVRLILHENDADKISDPALNASGFFGLELSALPADEILKDGDVLMLGDEEIRVISTPGHTSGSVCYDCGKDLVCGDTLFSSGYGRYDLPTGDPKMLFDSLKLLSMRQDDPMIYPGHGSYCRLSEADVIIGLRKNNRN